MGLKDDINKEVGDILDWKFTVAEEKKKVPEKSDLTLGKTAIKLTTSVLYVDMRGSSTFAAEHRNTTAAKVYNTYLNAMVRVVKTVAAGSEALTEPVSWYSSIPILGLCCLMSRWTRQ